MGASLGGPTGFALQFQNFMYYAGPIAQVLFWVVLGVASIWAAATFKRLVDFMTAGDAVAKKAAKADTKSVEEFVE